MTTSICVDEHQRKYVLSIEQLVQLNLEIPDIQRECDHDRVQEIILYQNEYFAQHKTFCFIGDLTVYQFYDKRKIDQNPLSGLFIVDGMHRYMAMKHMSLYMQKPDYPICINIISSACGLSIQDLFQIINMAKPVPSYVIQTVANQSLRFVVDIIMEKIAQEFKIFLSKSEYPRAPQFNLQNLANRLSTSKALHICTSIDMLFYFCLFANNVLASQKSNGHIRAQEKAQKYNARTICYFFVDPHFYWLDDDDLIHRFQKEYFSCGKEGLHDPHLSFLPPNVPTQHERIRRRVISKKLKNDLWKQHFDQNAEGLCKCCLREKITYLNFEAGHIVSIKNKGSNQIHNLLPICRPCNLSMGTQNLYQYQNECGYMDTI